MAGGWWWTPAEEEDDGVAPSSPPVLSGEYQALEMSTMVSALAHVVAGGDDEDPAAAMSGGGGGYVHGSYHYPAASAPTPEFAAGERTRSMHHFSITRDR